MIETDWNRRVQDSIRKEKPEVETRYGIRIGKTQIHCAKCGCPWGFGNHTCQDVRFKQLQEKEKEKEEILKNHKESLLDRLQKIGAKKISTISFNGGTGSSISEKAISQWIYRGNIPLRYVERITSLINGVSQ